MKCRVCGQKFKWCTICKFLHHVSNDGRYDFMLADHDPIEDIDNLDRQERSNETKGTAK